MEKFLNKVRLYHSRSSDAGSLILRTDEVRGKRIRFLLSGSSLTLFLSLGFSELARVRALLWE